MLAVLARNVSGTEREVEGVWMDAVPPTRAEQRPARRGPLPALALAGWVATVAASGIAVALRIASGAPMVENRFQFGDASMAGMVVLNLTFASVGALVAWRRPTHPIGWLLLASGLVYAISIAAGAYVSFEVTAGAAQAGPALWAGVVADASAYLAPFLMFWVVLIFPDGRVPLQGWRRWRGRFLAYLAVTSVLLLVRPGHLWLYPQLENPLAVPAPLAAVTQTAMLVLLTGGLMAITAAVPIFLRRVRRARGVERQQLKWFAVAGMAWIAALFLSFITAALPGRALLGELPLTAFLLAASLMPIAIGVAILRHRLYDIDLIIRRTLSYAALTVMLAAMYAALVLVLQVVLAPVTQQSSIAIAASTLAVAAVFQPVRRRIQRSVDRRFYRSRYDAARTIEAFSARLREPVDLERLSGELRAAVQDTMRPETISIWLAPRGEPSAQDAR